MRRHGHGPPPVITPLTPPQPPYPRSDGDSLISDTFSPLERAHYHNAKRNRDYDAQTPQSAEPQPRHLQANGYPVWNEEFSTPTLVKNELQAAAKTIQDLRAELTRRDALISNLEQANADHRETTFSMGKEVRKMDKLLAKERSNCTRLHKDIAELNKALTRQKERNQQLHSEVTKSQSLQSENERLVGKLKSYKTALCNCKAKLERMKAGLDKRDAVSAAVTSPPLPPDSPNVRLDIVEKQLQRGKEKDLGECTSKRTRSDGRHERVYTSGQRLALYPNGTVKLTDADNHRAVYRYPNGDVREVNHKGPTTYWYRNGDMVIEHADGRVQKVQKHP